MVGDGLGGVIIAYNDYYSSQGSGGAVRIRVQKIDSSGILNWDTIGTRVSLRDTTQTDEQIASDGKSGCFVAWFENNSVMLQRISRFGIRMWGDSGIQIGVLGSRVLPLASDGKGGCIIQIDSLTMRYDSSGTAVWGSGGVGSSPGSILVLQSDNSGGMVGGGMIGRGYNGGDPYYGATVQQLDSIGEKRFGADGLIIADSIQNIVLNAPAIAVEYLANHMTAYEWYQRVGADSLNTFTQLLRADGSTVFTSGGIRVSLVQAKYKVGGRWMATGLAGRIIHLWTDSRLNAGIYAQLIDTGGQRMWDPMDVPVILGSLGGIKTTTDCSGGMIVAGWRESDNSIYVQQLSRFGNLGEVISSVPDSKHTTIPYKVELFQNYPNPSNGSTVIQYSLPRSFQVSIVIANVLGQVVEHLYDGFQPPGTHSLIFNADHLASGTYMLRLTAGSVPALTRRMLFLR